MKIAHFSDTHLGFAAYDAADPASGVNRRELDFYGAFLRAIDGILEARPDAVIHAGDLYDSVRPANRAIAVCMEGFAKLSRAGIPAVVVAGNHEAPRIRTTGSILRALGALPHVFPVFDAEYRAIDLGRLVVHGVSDAPSDAELEASLAKVKAVPGKLNVLAAHGGLRRESGQIESGEYNEHLFPPELLGGLSDLDYIALGHYHRHMQVTPNAWYCGSTERTSFSQASYTPGFVIVELPGGAPKHHAIEVRAMQSFPTIDARGLAARDVLDAIARTLRSEKLDGILGRIIVENLSSSARDGLDPKALRELTQAGMHFEWDFRIRDEERRTASAGLAIRPLEKEFEEFMKEAKIDGGRKRMLELGLDYLARVRAEEEPHED